MENMFKLYLLLLLYAWPLGLASYIIQKMMREEE
jgi:hypothetical protein